MLDNFENLTCSSRSSGHMYLVKNILLVAFNHISIPKPQLVLIYMRVKNRWNSCLFWFSFYAVSAFMVNYILHILSKMQWKLCFTTTEF